MNNFVFDENYKTITKIICIMINVINKKRYEFFVYQSYVNGNNYRAITNHMRIHNNTARE